MLEPSSAEVGPIDFLSGGTIVSVIDHPVNYSDIICIIYSPSSHLFHLRISQKVRWWFSRCFIGIIGACERAGMPWSVSREPVCLRKPAVAPPDGSERTVESSRIASQRLGERHGLEGICIL